VIGESDPPVEGDPTSSTSSPESVTPTDTAEATERTDDLTNVSISAPLSAVGRAQQAVGGFASRLLGSAQQTALATGRFARLTFLSPTAKPGTTDAVPSVTDLAESFHAWLQQRGREPTMESDGERVVVTAVEPGLFETRLNFHFVPSIDDRATNRILELGIKSTALVGLAWPHARQDLDDATSVFVWSDLVRLGPMNSASATLSEWLVDTTGFQFEWKALRAAIETKPRPSTMLVGRDRELAWFGETLGRISVGPLRVVAVVGPGGFGKSYLLRHVAGLFASRIVFAVVDPTQLEAGSDIAEILNHMIRQIEQDACPVPRARKASASAQRHARELERNRAAAKPDPAPASVGSSWLRILVPGARVVTEVVGGAAEVGFDLLQEQMVRQREAYEALATSAPIRTITDAFVEDLREFVQKQQRHYLWRRPVFLFDTYEKLAPLVDSWLRTVLLAHEGFLELSAVVIIAGRNPLTKEDTRWTEHQDSIQTIPLGGLTREQSIDYLYRLGVADDHVAERLWQLTEGSPLFLHLAASARSEEEAVLHLGDRILEEIDPEWRPIVVDLAVADTFNFDRVLLLVQDEARARQGFAQLKAASFVRPIAAGQWGYDSHVQRVLVRYLALESPERLARARVLLTSMS